MPRAPGKRKRKFEYWCWQEMNTPSLVASQGVQSALDFSGLNEMVALDHPQLRLGYSAPGLTPVTGITAQSSRRTTPSSRVACVTIRAGKCALEKHAWGTISGVVVWPHRWWRQSLY